jgi:alpha-galactosidase
VAAGPAALGQDGAVEHAEADRPDPTASDPTASDPTATDPTASDPVTARIDAGGWGLTWLADDEGRLHQLGLGPDGHRATADAPIVLYPDAHPTWGGPDPYRPPALRVTHAEGTATTRLRAVRTDVEDLDGDDDVTVHTVDELLTLRVRFRFRTHRASGVLEQWVEVDHDEDGPVTLFDYDSLAVMLLVGPAAQVVQFGGSGWADEWAWTAESLTPGTKVLDSLGGIQPHLQRSPVVLVEPDGPAGEHEGAVIGCSVAWGGNVRIALDVRPRAGQPQSDLRLRAGANPLGAHYVLDPGTTFVTPTVAWTWCTQGRHQLTERFHRWSRDRVLRDPERTRPIVVNNWEATFFDFDQARLEGLVDRTADLGADLFLLDDGWFGTAHPRDDDTAGLGDWDVDRRKLPDGLAPLVDRAAALGVRFGIWVEPEMVNPRSELHDAHPDWVIRDRREPRLHRNQLALDPLLDEVRDFEVGVVDRALAAAPGASYVKWDANRPVTDPGSRALPADRQSNAWVDWVRATWSVMERVAAAHPDVELMLCASGGGRTDHGTLRWFHEFWTSDNTDPVTRVRMQWACQHVFPASAVAAHVTAWGARPLDFACAVALSGRFGIDLDLGSLDDERLAVCRRAVACAQRTQPWVQHGTLHRLVSPVEGADRSRAALAFVAPDRSGAVVFAYQLDAADGPGPALTLPGLDPDATYRVGVTDLRAGSGEPETVAEATGAQLGRHLAGWELTEATTARIVEVDRVG